MNELKNSTGKLDGLLGETRPLYACSKYVVSGR
jgi:hypothetical protein